MIFKRELKQKQQRRRGGRRRQCVVKHKVTFYQRNLRLSKPIRIDNGSKNVLKLNMQRRRSIPNANTKISRRRLRSGRRRTWSFHVLFCRGWQRNVQRFSDVLVAVVVVVCSSSLINKERKNVNWLSSAYFGERDQWRLIFRIAFLALRI